LREARNRDVFLAKAKSILGYPIEVIAGREEARLIYMGVSHLLPQSPERRLVIDIGGRSTELILGQNALASTLESYRVGSVAWSMKYFPDGIWTSSAFKAAEIAAKAVLDEAQILYPRQSWDTCYGASGTVGAVADVLTLAGWPEGLITRSGLDWLKDKLLKAQKPESLKLEGIKEDRRPVIGGVRFAADRRNARRSRRFTPWRFVRSAGPGKPPGRCAHADGVLAHTAFWLGLDPGRTGLSHRANFAVGHAGQII
jgi:exopolyphosphatase/guanosine-5'-triphosphate,3'-diphosphate pyrophosphatase